MKKAKDKSARSKPDSTQPEKHRKGYIHNHKRTIARFEADTPEDYDFAKGVIDAGFRVKDHALEWGMNPDDYWQLACFPSDPDDWKTRMERLATHSLHDKDASDLGSLMHSCAWTIQQLWKWLHHLAEYAQNSNIKRDAGQTLGKLYHEARQKKSRTKLGRANEEFERQVAPFAGSGVKPAKALVHWVNQKLMWQFELWKRAIEVAQRFHEKRPYYEYSHSGTNSERHTTLVGIHSMASIQEAWRGFFSANRKRKGESWNDLLDKLEDHPFCKGGLTLEQLIDFDTCWNDALEPVLRQEWTALNDQERRGIGKDLSFEHRVGTVKDPRAGYWVAKDFFDRGFLLHWEQVQKFDRLFKESMRQESFGTGTAVDPVTSMILAKSGKEKVKRWVN